MSSSVLKWVGGKAPAPKQTGREVTTENTQFLRTIRRVSDGDASCSTDAPAHRNTIHSGHQSKTREFLSSSEDLSGTSYSESERDAIDGLLQLSMSI